MDKEKEMLKQLLAERRDELVEVWYDLKEAAAKLGGLSFRISFEEDSIFVRVGSAVWFTEERIFTDERD